MVKVLRALAIALALTHINPGGCCPTTDKVLVGVSIYKGGIIAAQANVSSEADCCDLCHGDYKDECAAWEWVDQSKVASPGHNCDVFAKSGPAQTGFTGRVVGFPADAPPAPTPPAPPSEVGPPCHNDGDCAAAWGTSTWRCLEHLGAQPSSLNSCHMHATTRNSTCACQPSPCTGGTGAAVWRTGPAAASASANSTPAAAAAKFRMLVIGDSISQGMFSKLQALMAPSGWSLAHNPGNGDNTNYGAHCVPAWTDSANGIFDVISFQFGLHDIAYDEERLTEDQYATQLANITAHLAAVQKQHGTKLLWVKTTPVPTVTSYGFGCNGTATVCLNPARFESDVMRYNAAADAVVAAAVRNGATIATADLHSFVVGKCGGSPTYASCPGFQLPMNVRRSKIPLSNQ